MELAIVAALLAVSEVLSFIPSISSNGVFQFTASILKKLVGKDKPKK